jgi:hypothetical protein
VTTSQTAAGAWSARAALPDDDEHFALADRDDTYDSEDEARRAALSTAAEAIDRARSSQGKP